MNKLSRREFLMAGLIGSAALPGFIHLALGAGKKDYPQGIWEIKGDVKLNGRAARKGNLINPGDVIETGDPESRAVFISGKDVFMLRDNTRIEIDHMAKNTPDQLIDFLRVANGKLMGVFGPGKKQIHTPTAIAGIRGTGIYIEAEAEKTYLCTCYGKMDIWARENMKQKKQITSFHHDAPQYIFKHEKKDNLIIKADTMSNHTDAELILLESLAGRIPPFHKKQTKSFKPSSGY